MNQSTMFIFFTTSNSMFGTSIYLNYVFFLPAKVKHDGYLLDCGSSVGLGESSFAPSKVCGYRFSLHTRFCDGWVFAQLISNPPRFLP
jgi:hypothetical protein